MKALSTAKEIFGDFGLQIFVFMAAFLGIMTAGFLTDRPVQGIVFGAVIGILLASSTIIVD